MPTKADRLPSEQTPERELADKLDEFMAELRNVETRNLERLRASSWWDQLATGAEKAFGMNNNMSQWQLPSPNYAYASTMRVLQMPNCMDLMLLDATGSVWWQRRLFFGPPASP